jgi:hypothetical protein
MKNNKKEKCILCHKKTIYTVGTHIDERLYYISGAGQLCKECYDKLYNKDNTEN